MPPPGTARRLEQTITSKQTNVLLAIQMPATRAALNSNEIVQRLGDISAIIVLCISNMLQNYNQQHLFSFILFICLAAHVREVLMSHRPLTETGEMRRGTWIESFPLSI